jgi:hypothetical protein
MIRSIRYLIWSMRVAALLMDRGVRETIVGDVIERISHRFDEGLTPKQAVDMALKRL